MIRLITPQDNDSLEEFFLNAKTSEDHREDIFDNIKILSRTNPYYRGFAYFFDNKIQSVCYMREVIEQKIQILDFMSTRKNTNIYFNKLGDVLDHAITYGEQKGIFRFYTFLTDDKIETLDEIKKKDLVFKFRQRYDTYYEEIIPPNCFSKYSVHWNYLMNSTLRSQKKNIRQHQLKNDYREKLLKL